MQDNPPIPAAQDEILCPLCDYNLHGLTEPRCPECGGRFNWDELRDRSRRSHPYLFEHHPERNFWSWYRTLVGGLRSTKFWTTLYPTQPSKPRRLLLYWMVYAIIGLLGNVPGWVLGARRMYMSTVDQRSRQLTWLTGGNSGVKPGVATKSVHEFFEQLRLRMQYRDMGYASDQTVDGIKRQFGSIQAYLDQILPLPPSPKFFRSVFFNNPWQRQTLTTSMAILLLAVAWPIVAALTLTIFRSTMRKAKVRFVHLMRITVYSGDVMLWIGLLVLLAVMLGLLNDWPTIGRRYSRPNMTFVWLMSTANLLPYLALIIMTYRLAVAIRRYLRFDHAIATAIAVQIICVLFGFKLILMMNGY